MAFLDFAHILWEASKPTIVVTDNKSVTRFFQTKAIPPSLWNPCDYVRQLNFKIAHIAGLVNTAADFLCRLKLKVTEKIHLKIREDVQTTPEEVTTSSSDVADEKQFFITQGDGQDETEEQIPHRKEQSQKTAGEWIVNQEPSSMKPSVKDFTKIDGNNTLYSISGIKANARIRVEQDADLVLKNPKLKMLGQPQDDVLLTTERRFKHYKANEDRIILKYGLLFRKNCEETGSVKYCHILIPEQHVNEVLRSLHGVFGKHLGITETINAYRETYYYPNLAQLIREWVMSFEQCLRISRTNPGLTRPPLQIPNQNITAPEDAMQIDLVTGLSPSVGFENIVTAMDVFSRYLFEYPKSYQDAKAFAEVINNIMTKHAYLPTTLTSDKGTAFMSHVVKEVAGFLGITIQHATTKHAQTIGLLKRSHASVKQALKIETSVRRSLWHKYVSIAVLNYNTSYHASISCEPSRVFHWRVPYNVLVLKMGIHPQKNSLQTHKPPKMCLNRRKWFFKMSVKMQCKPIWNKKRNMIKRPMPQNLNKPITFTSYSRKQITKEAKFVLQIFGGLDLLLLKRCYRTINIWFVNLAPTRRKYFLE